MCVHQMFTLLGQVRVKIFMTSIEKYIKDEDRSPVNKEPVYRTTVAERTTCVRSGHWTVSELTLPLLA